MTIDIKSELKQVCASLETDLAAEATLHAAWEVELAELAQKSPKYLAWLRLHAANLERKHEVLERLVNEIHPGLLAGLPNDSWPIGNAMFSQAMCDPEWHQHAESVVGFLRDAAIASTVSPKSEVSEPAQPPADGSEEAK
jgi:hypothetical protein